MSRLKREFAAGVGIGEPVCLPQHAEKTEINCLTSVYPLTLVNRV
jgi:hypothetical protein